MTIKAGTAHDVVSFATELQPDAIILDLHIGGDTRGVEVARDIHDVTTIPTVFISRLSDDMRPNEHAVPRPYRNLTRPFLIEDVHIAIQDMLAGQTGQAARRAQA